MAEPSYSQVQKEYRDHLRGAAAVAAEAVRISLQSSFTIDPLAAYIWRAASDEEIAAEIRVGPFDQGTRLVTPRAELAPAADGSGEWTVTDRGEVRYRAPLERYRVSVLWKADVYRDEAEQRRQMADTLSIPDVARIFDRDLEVKGADVHVDLDRIEDPGLIAAVNAVYPEAVPVGKQPSIFDAA